MNAHNDSGSLAGPLRGLRVVEFAGIGPGPFAGMLLSDMGADVVRIDRPGSGGCDPRDFVSRGRRLVRLDLKSAEGREQALALVEHADALIEGFRPGVMERLGLGPNDVGARNPRLVYGRMTGWGQTGPLAKAAGHDINYIALSGALAAIGPEAGDPVPPLNLVGDYAGGAMFLVSGVLAALLSAGRTGQGQVVDAAMCDGVSVLLSLFHTRRALGLWGPPGTNTLDGGSHFYGSFRCADGRFLSIGPLEPQFYAEFRRIAGLEDAAFDAQHDRARWPELREKVAQAIAGKTRDEWTRLFEGSEACVAPILALEEAPDHPHLVARETFIERDGVRQAAPAPRFSRTPGAVSPLPMGAATSPAAVLAAWRKPG